MEQETNHCSQCGVEVPAGANFCAKCGCKLDSTAPEPIDYEYMTRQVARDFLLGQAVAQEIDKWAKQGWEVVSQSQGKHWSGMQSVLITFRRPKTSLDSDSEPSVAQTSFGGCCLLPSLCCLAGSMLLVLLMVRL